MMNSPFRRGTITGNGRSVADANATTIQIESMLGYRLALGRSATSQEVERSLTFLDRGMCEDDDDNQRQRPDSEQKAWAGFCQVVLASAEFRYLE